MPKLTFFPSGNAGGCLVDLADGRQILFDYANYHNESDDSDKRIDLGQYLRDDLKDRDRSDYDVVAFTHVDDDHIHGSSEFFEFQHSPSYQGSERIKIKELWVPAAAIIETGLTGESRLIRQEARYRLKQGSGVRVFSRPNLLKEWLEDNGLTIEERKNLITDAGQLVPGFDQSQVEIFVHSPFAKRVDEGNVEVRNRDSIVLHFSFICGAVVTRFLLTSDIEFDVLADIVRVTKSHGRENRLEMDIVDIPHHCSYKGLGPEKGSDVTETDSDVNWLYREKGGENLIIVSASKPIPGNDDDPQPPHRQAAEYYRDVVEAKSGGEFKVTMEHPKVTDPKPLIIDIDSSKGKIRKSYGGPLIRVLGSAAPKAG